MCSAILVFLSFIAFFFSTCNTKTPDKLFPRFTDSFNKTASIWKLGSWLVVVVAFTLQSLFFISSFWLWPIHSGPGDIDFLLEKRGAAWKIGFRGSKEVYMNRTEKRCYMEDKTIRETESLSRQLLPSWKITGTFVCFLFHSLMDSGASSATL